MDEDRDIEVQRTKQEKKLIACNAELARLIQKNEAYQKVFGDELKQHYRRADLALNALLGAPLEGDVTVRYLKAAQLQFQKDFFSSFGQTPQYWLEMEERMLEEERQEKERLKEEADGEESEEDEDE